MGGLKQIYMTSRGMADGDCPVGGVTVDEAGNIYGTAAWGAAGYGVVWEITPD